ncbi:MAG: DegT/DnrJ/EryC1/StrS family aminotransferase, partial [Candidatus Tectomicrobia bacterium]|nr:DegT/DnrJ/EryC1/StrS family aminotransferase [Candidatus Tectomicrobia bacterium]
ALGAGPGDTIICPSLTFVATANAIRYTGATPVFADITSPDDLNIAPGAIEAKIDETTKGICVVHYGGYPCDMDRIMDIARRYHLYVVEDVAHAPGAACWVSDDVGPEADNGRTLRPCGSLGDIGCFSFFSNKNMTTGEGGMITTNREDVAEKIRLLRSHGMTSLTWDRQQGHGFSYDVVELGYNYRIDEIRSAIGLVQLDKLDKNNQKRANETHFYQEHLCDINYIDTPFSNCPSVASYHIFPILLKNKMARDHFMTFMKRKGVQTSIHYPPIHRFSYYQSSWSASDLPVTEEVGAREVTLPLYSGMERDQQQYVVQSIKEWVASAP